MSLQEAWIWLDALAPIAFSSSESLESRAFFARWWAEVAEQLTIDIEL